MPTSSTRTSRRTPLDTPAALTNVAVFAADRATSCRFLPLLPPITRNVTLPILANRLEFRIHARSVADRDLQSGKNGNVDWGGQHCSLSIHRILYWLDSAARVGYHGTRRIGYGGPSLNVERTSSLYH